ncbi:two-component response regulator [Malaciobacter pacificus]|uniref:Two-component system response regulator n=1 Tax=Malaciobacter pacificus TaxID=1080223 RepID=A0A5C2H8Z6_9BACT|nr:response regulator transcription factor [Malaciobacter pacificus]QEP35407.1 two-component system response regulator [Malaciobacter pacificus]GGD38792.1 two-component response regulator [Malaciobacter pacificus]
MDFNVLVIEDDVQLNFVISEYFKMKSYNTISIHDGIEAIDEIDKITNRDINLYVIDINLPSLNGIDILKYIREKDSTTPIIIITASLEIENFIKAFEYGCSEYIKKPFHIKELEVRVNKLLNNNISTIQFDDDLYYNFNTKSFFYKENEIELRNKEKRLVEVLLQNINKIVPVEIIYDYVWEGEEKDSFPLRQLLADVRKKLPYDIIKTKIKQGYIIEN